MEIVVNKNEDAVAFKDLIVGEIFILKTIGNPGKIWIKLNNISALKLNDRKCDVNEISQTARVEQIEIVKCEINII